MGPEIAGWTVTDAPWNQYLKGEEYKGPLTYKGRSPSDEPGTDAYFRHIMGSLRREAESRSYWPEGKPKASKVKVKVQRRSDGILTSQRCDMCQMTIPPGPCWTFMGLPHVLCVTCKQNEKITHIGTIRKFEFVLAEMGAPGE
jgi:hypothetical protein